MDALELFEAYLTAFNGRDAEAMGRLFAPDLRTVHPAEPEVDVTEATSFLERMQALWPKGLRYHLLRASGRELGDGVSESWGEVLVYNSQSQVVAAEVVIYNARHGLVTNTWVYKVLAPSHPDYRQLPA